MRPTQISAHAILQTRFCATPECEHDADSSSRFCAPCRRGMRPLVTEWRIDLEQQRASDPVVLPPRTFDRVTCAATTQKGWRKGLNCLGYPANGSIYCAKHKAHFAGARGKS